MNATKIVKITGILVSLVAGTAAITVIGNTAMSQGGSYNQNAFSYAIIILVAVALSTWAISAVKDD